MATPLSFSPVFDWTDHNNPANIPPTVRIISASDMLRWENSHKALTDRVNEHDSLVTNLTNEVSTLTDQVAALETANASQATQISDLSASIAVRDAQVAALNRGLVVRASTDAYTVLATNRIHLHGGGAANYTLPDATLNAGKDFVFYNRGTGTVTLSSLSLQIYVNGTSGNSLALPAAQAYWMVSDGTQWVVFINDSMASV